MSPEEQDERFGLDREELFAVIFALITGLILMLTLFRCTPVAGMLGFDGEEVTEPITVVVDEAGSKLDEVAQSPATAKTDGGDTAEPVTTVSTDDGAEVATPTGDDVDLEGKLASANNRLSNTESDLKALKGNHQKLSGDLEAANADHSKAAELASAALAKHQGEINSLTSQVDTDAAELKRLKAEAAEMKKQLADANKAAADARAAAETAREAAAEAEKARKAAEAEAARVNGEPRKLFVAEEDLAPRVRAVSSDLRGIHRQDGQLAALPIAEAYEKVWENHGARLLQKVKFGSGKSGIGQGATEILAKAARDASGDSRFVVVGYADKSGTAETNRRISEARAVSVATALETVPGVGERLQAVYIGETDRFSKTDAAENRLVEIWEVVPR